MSIHTTSLIHPNVDLDSEHTVGPFVIIGEPPRNTEPGELPTSIGSQATIRSHTVIYAGNTIGARFQTGHGVMLREANTIGNDVSIGTHSIVEHHVQIGNGVRIHSNVFVPEYSYLHDECWLGPSVTVTNARYPRSKNSKENLQGVTIHHGAKIGAGAVLLPGVVIGRHALVGAGAVIVKDVPDYAVVVGNPARVINTITDIPNYEIED